MEYIKVKKGDKITLTFTQNIDGMDSIIVEKTITFMKDKTVNQQKLHRKHFKELKIKVQTIINKQKTQKSKSFPAINNKNDLEKICQ